MANREQIKDKKSRFQSETPKVGYYSKAKHLLGSKQIPANNFAFSFDSQIQSSALPGGVPGISPPPVVVVNYMVTELNNQLITEGNDNIIT